MLTAGKMANYGFMLKIHDNVLYKTKNGHKRGEIKTKLYFVITKKMIRYKVQLLVDEH